jgi:hypothetical protein
MSDTADELRAIVGDRVIRQIDEWSDWKHEAYMGLSSVMAVLTSLLERFPEDDQIYFECARFSKAYKAIYGEGAQTTWEWREEKAHGMQRKEEGQEG